MSYNTAYKLRVINPTDESDMIFPQIVDNYIRGELKNIYPEDFSEFRYCLSSINNKTYLSGEPGSWYYHSDSMERLSAKFPDYLFFLSGEGEESGDVWREYYFNGKLFKRSEPLVSWPVVNFSEIINLQLEKSEMLRIAKEKEQEATDRAEFERLKAKFGE